MMSRALPRGALKAVPRLSSVHRAASALAASPAVLSMFAPRPFSACTSPALAQLPRLARDPMMAAVAARAFPLASIRVFSTATTVPVAPVAAAAAAPKASETASSAEGEGKEEVKKQSRMATLLKAYGPIAIATYLGIYVLTLGAIFLVVNASSELSAEDIIAKIEEKGWVSGSLKTRLDNMVKGASPTWVNFAAAWILTKFTEPLRLVITGLITPSVARHFGRAPPPTAAKAAAFLPLIFIPALASRLTAEVNEKEI